MESSRTGSAEPSVNLAEPPNLKKFEFSRKIRVFSHKLVILAKFEVSMSVVERINYANAM